MSLAEWFENHRKALVERMRTSRERQRGPKRMVAIHDAVIRLLENNGEGRVEAAVSLYERWGDELDAAGKSYLRASLNEFDRHPGNVLISSAGLMTFILGVAAERDKGRQVWCLEHDLHWIAVLRSWFKRYAIKGAYMIQVPVRIIGGMVRYQIHPRHLPKNISLIICERAGTAPGSALSTLLTVAPNLATEFTAVCRRVDVHAEAPLLRRWAQKHQASFVVVDSARGLVKLTRTTNIRSGRAEYAVADPTERPAETATA